MTSAWLNGNTVLFLGRASFRVRVWIEVRNWIYNQGTATVKVISHDQSLASDLEKALAREL